MDLPTMRTNLRRDLKDETPTTQIPTTIDNCDAGWTAMPDCVTGQGYSDKQEGVSCILVQIGDAHTTGLAAYRDRTALDLTGYHVLRFWIKSTINLDAGDYQIVLDDTAGCGSPVKTVDIPAGWAGYWYEHEVVLGDTAGMSSIISVGLNVAVDKGLCTVRLDDIRAIKNTYKWTDDELDRHIAHTLKDLSYYIPYEYNAELATVSGSREVSIATLSSRIKVFAVEYPVGEYPPRYQRFSLWQDTITLLGDEVPDGSNCKVYYGKLHTLDAESSTLPAHLEDLLSQGAQGYALQAYAAYAVDRLQADYHYAGERAAQDAGELLSDFRWQLKKLGRFGKVRSNQLYTPATLPVSKSTDWGV